MVRAASRQAAIHYDSEPMTKKTYDVVVVGTGVFGVWTAFELRRAGKKVALLDAHGPANSRASSGGESRIIRMGYGKDEIYTRSSIRSFGLWQEFFQRTGQSSDGLFHRTGVLWMAHGDDQRIKDTLATLEKLNIPHQRLSRAELESQYPQVDFGPVSWGLLEPESGVLAARRCVRAVLEAALDAGVAYAAEAVEPPRGESRLEAVRTRSGAPFGAADFVFACGAWLPQVFPELLAGLIFPTRQEVFFFGVPAGDRRFAPPAFPTWIDLTDEAYGIPDIEGRGLKVAFDRHGPPFDPETGSRAVTAQGLQAMVDFLGKRFPELKDAPVLETRVCQYENTSNGDFLIDRHPELENVWIVGGGSGHGFKHGPAVGEYVAARILEGGALEPRFSLAGKQKAQTRAVY